MTLNTLALPWDPYITKMELKRGSKEYYDFEGMFKEIWFDIQVSNLVPQYSSKILQSHLLIRGAFMNVLIFAIFQNLLNFTYLVKKQSDGLWGSSNSSGRYKGMIGALHLKEVDIGILIM